MTWAPLMYINFTAITFIIACVVLVLITRGIIASHAGSISFTQRVRIRIFVTLILSAVGGTFLAITTRWIHTDVHIVRQYQNPATDSEALAAAEAFNYNVVSEQTYSDYWSIFPPYPYQDRLIFLPTQYQPTTVSYSANITRPASSVNTTAVLAPWGGAYLFTGEWVLANGTWEAVDDTGGAVIGVEWLVTVIYQESGDSRWEDRIQVVGLNATREVMYVARGSTTMCVDFISPFTFYMPVFLAVIIVVGFVVLDVDRATAPFKRPPRHVTVENLMENETRVAIVQAIRDNPGITFSGLVRTVVRSPRTMLEQLGVLQRFGIVRAREIRHNTAFFDVAASGERDLLDYFSSHASFEAIVQNINNSPGISFVALQKRLDEPRSTLMRKVRILEQHGVVRVTREAGQLVSLDIP